MKKAILISFSIKTKKFRSKYEMTKFFRELYGWKQVVSSNSNKYTYEREGVLDKVPHMRVDQSSFLVPEDFADEIFDFFEQWSNKIIFKAFKVLLEEDPEW